MRAVSRVHGMNATFYDMPFLVLGSKRLLVVQNDHAI